MTSQSVQSAEGHVFDIIGIGIGPFNLGLACLTQPIRDLDCLFLERKDQFNWHEGTLLETATLQTPFLCDLVTLADPTSEFSFLNYLKQTGRIYAFYAFLLDTENFFLLRNEFNKYYRWAAGRLDNVVFNREVETVEYDEEAGVYRVTSLNTKMGQRKVLLARRIVLGSGMSPAVPAPCEAVRDKLLHSADYLRNREAVRQKKSITVVGSGQSAAEVYHDLLSDIDRYGYRLNWVTRSSRLVPRELTKFTLQMTTPDYADYFFSLSRSKREDLVRAMQSIFKGVNPSLINDIYDLRYRKLLGGDVDMMLISNTEVEACTHDAASDSFRVTFRQVEEEKSFELETEALIMGTGYRFRMPDYLRPISDRINWCGEGRFAVARNCSIDTKGSEIFVQNAEIHADSYLPPDLGQSCYRNSIIIREVLGKEYYPVERSLAFQRFSSPVDGLTAAVSAGG
ncbi:lysine N(6)-hydroxylase/L-ornithine N(5)-oxygenase family protein [Stappia indica]|uniref:Lysine N6-hydroxylase n=1 Tax=Stappia indica TaxID=538381 RepID=A0A285RNW5_9HYPH|nr:SidA/IucD/PvdA family monooxygenase [Stappia indica]SOB95805.1 lysine N6-hydroxylase [Stappia indica]